MATQVESTTPSSCYYQNKVAVITGGGSGIGKALCVALANSGATVVVCDVLGAREVSAVLPGRSDHFDCDVTNPQQVEAMIQMVVRRYGRIDVYCSNAGIMPPASEDGMEPQDFLEGVISHSIPQWKTVMDVNVLSHVIALRLLLPYWRQGIGAGRFLVTVSAAGILTQLFNASYGVSKAAALSFCEHVAITYPFVNVHCLCPMGVATPLYDRAMTANATSQAIFGPDRVLPAQEVAEYALTMVEKGDFFIFPHSQLARYAARKAKNHSRWLKGMQRLQQRLMKQSGDGTAILLPDSSKL